MNPYALSNSLSPTPIRPPRTVEANLKAPDSSLAVEVAAAPFGAFWAVPVVTMAAATAAMAVAVSKGSWRRSYGQSQPLLGEIHG